MFQNEHTRAIKKALKADYYWAHVKSLEPGYAETVDFCIPDTHSFWSQGFISHNTPERFGSWGYDLVEGDEGDRLRETSGGLEIVRASSRDNKALGDEYVEAMLASLSDKAAEAYIEGKFVNLASGTVYYGFDRQTNVVDLERPAFGYEYGCGMDFNVNPMSAVVFWRKDDHVHVIDEIELPNADTEAMARELRNRYEYTLNKIYPDASGNNRSTKAPRGKSDFTYLRDAGYTIHAKSKNPAIKDRYNAVNGKLCPAIGVPSLTISPKCTKLIKYLSQYNHEELTKKEQVAMSHLLDAFSYPIAYLYPVSKETLREQGLTGV